MELSPLARRATAEDRVEGPGTDERFGIPTLGYRATWLNPSPRVPALERAKEAHAKLILDRR